MPLHHLGAYLNDHLAGSITGVDEGRRVSPAERLRQSACRFVTVRVDPFEPPMPPKTSLKQTGRFARSLLRGQPNQEKIIVTVAPRMACREMI